MAAAACVVAGALIVVWILNDIFSTVLLPRAVQNEWRLSVISMRAWWRAWRRLALNLVEKRREELLGSFAPFGFIAVLFLWLVGLAAGYGLIYYGVAGQLRPPPATIWTAFYDGAASLIGPYGDFTPVGGAARVVALLDGASGISVTAVAIAFLFSILSAFGQRERFVVVLDSRAGAPPSGVALLETYASDDLRASLPALFHDSCSWVADVLNSHLAFPIIMYFRSGHRDESWIAALGALLDAAALAVTVIEDVPRGEARLFLDVGAHLAHDLETFFDLPEARCPTPSGEQLAQIRGRLVKAGYRLSDDEARWREFSDLRTSYAAPLEGIGMRWLISSAPLIGERTALPGHEV